MTWRIAGTVLTALILWSSVDAVWAQTLHMMESSPSASAITDGRSNQFFIRFDKPVDHIRSALSITQDGRVVETLHPSLDSAPEVLFAQAPRLPAGDYKLHWAVRTMSGAQITEGDIPFKVGS
jgi:methionine-rich copper-binding protein CopC